MTAPQDGRERVDAGSERAAHTGLKAPPDAFAFGRNWERYVARYLTPERITAARQSVESLVGDVRGNTFLDVGAGSGLFSLAAHELGAAQVLSLDVDVDSVRSCRNLHAGYGSPANWLIREGSILDDDVVTDLGQADIVYSWGVLHHTGDMYRAIRNAARLVRPGGRFCISIYNRGRTRFLTSERWARIKRSYNRAPRPLQLAMEGLYLTYFLQGEARAKRRNPVTAIRDYGGNRGMAFRTDVIDWLGGYPYEYATVDEIVSFCERECGMETIKVVPDDPEGFSTNEFVFRRL